MNDPIMQIRGRDGAIELLSDRLIISRPGFLNFFIYGWNSRQEIPIVAISTIHFRNANVLRFGQIDFVYGGRGTVNPRKNPFAVTFTKKHDKQFFQLKESIFELMRQQTARTQTSSST